MGRDPSGAALVARDRTALDVGEVRQGKPVWRVGEARLALVQGQVILLQVLGLLLLEVLVKVFVVEVQEVFLFSLSSTTPTRTTPSTRPAGRCLGFWG